MGNGGGKAGVIETNCREMTPTRLFGEEVVHCNGTVKLIKAGFEALVEAPCMPKIKKFNCLYELKLIVDQTNERGIVNMNYSIAENAERIRYVRDCASSSRIPRM